MVIHVLKIESKYFADILQNNKRFEIRKNDRNYQVDDYVLLREVACGRYAGEEILAKISYVINSEIFPAALQDGYCVFGLKDICTLVRRAEV